ncbi:MAG: adenosylcobalamin-dependent ribonucleoside-diphosphate reductase [Arenicellales bacterium]
MSADPFTCDISRHIWKTRYRYRDGQTIHDQTVADTWKRIANALAGVEKRDRAAWAERFYHALEDFRFLPGGRIQAGSGTGRRVTLFNCFVMGRIEDSMDGIFDALKEGAVTMQQGGGVGYDFSTLRPAGSRARTVGRISSGPVSFMRIWDAMCATLLSTGSRRGAMMATLRCDHPDIETFVEAKREKVALRHFNLSVLVTDAFMQAVRNDGSWALVFPDGDLGDAEPGPEIVERAWSGSRESLPCRVFRRIPARDLWRRIMRATYDCAEPGVLFIDRINRLNNLHYREVISATNPCGEIPLPPYGACDLGSVNLTRFVDRPFTPGAGFDMAAFSTTVSVAVRMLDNVVDLSRFPLPRQEAQARGSRRIGLGVTGLADALIMMGLRYGDRAAVAFASEAMRGLCHTAYRTSTEIAREKGSFPFLETEAYLNGEFAGSLPEDIRRGIRETGIRNSHLVAIAPTGTISLLANNVSSGLEPVFDFTYRRRVLEAGGGSREYEITDHAFDLWRQRSGGSPLPDYFVDARGLDPEVHLAMQAAIQPFVDNAISKTINVPEDFDPVRFRSLYESAYEKGLKGCTTFRSNPVTGEVLSSVKDTSLCCSIEREAD